MKNLILLITLLVLDLGCSIRRATPNEIRPTPSDQRTDFDIKIRDKELQKILIENFKIKSGDTIVSLKEKLSTYLTKKNNETYNKIKDTNTKRILQGLNITEFPVVVTKLFLGYDGAEITEDTTLKSLSTGFVLALSKKVEINNSLKNKNLKGIRLNELDLTGVDFTGANLTHTSFIDTNLTNANFTDATLADANLMNAIFINANLTNTDLQQTNLFRANLTGANLTGAIVSQRELDNAIGVTQEQQNQVKNPP